MSTSTQLYKTEDQGVIRDDRGLTRVDVRPVVRIPFTKWPFLTVNSSVSWRGTYWSESLDPTNLAVQIPEGIGRRYFDFQARMTGPVFNRIFDTPNMAYAQKFKHVIEPTFTIERVTAIDVFNRVVQIDGNDRIPGSVTRINYGVNNRLYAKRQTSREIVGVSVTQTYYSDATASQYDPNYQNSFNSQAKPSSFSPIRIQSRVAPTDHFQTDFSTEFNTR